jgi:integrase/recombinase XerD
MKLPKTLGKRTEAALPSRHRIGHKSPKPIQLDTISTHFGSLSVSAHNVKYSATVFLREDAPRADGQCPVWFSCYINKERVRLSCNVHCHPTDWDKKNNRIKGRSFDVSDRNLIISNAMSLINKIFTNARLHHRILSVAEFKKQFFNPVSNESFVAFYEHELKRRLTLGSIVKTTFLADQKTLNKIKIFDPNVSFSALSVKWCEEFNSFLKKQYNNALNTRHNDFKHINTYLNIAIENGIVFDNPLKKFKVPRAKSERVFLDKSEVQQLEALYGSPQLNDRLHKTLRAFLFQIYTGLRDSDRKRLEKANIVGNELIFTAWKTRRTEKIVKVPLTENAMRFINEMAGRIVAGYSNQKQNQYLKEIARLINCKKNLSTHVARHTFATLYLESGGSVEVLQEILGHANIGTTMVYVHVINQRKKIEMERFSNYMNT